ncbi:unnamed protein product [Scytosiphon promiscuus]
MSAFPLRARRVSLYSSSPEPFRFGAEACRQEGMDMLCHDRSDDVGVPTHFDQKAAQKHNGRGDGLHPVPSCVTSNHDFQAALSSSNNHDVHLGKSSQRKAPHSHNSQRKSLQRKYARRGRRSRDLTLAEHFKASARKSVQVHSTAVEATDWAEQTEDRDQGDISLFHQTCNHQNDKDQRMWSALRTSLLSISGEDTDPTIVGLRIGSIEDGRSSDGGSACNRSSRIVVRRDMEQLHLERSAMDRTIRPHRIASARALEASQDSPLQTKVKQPRTFSASARRSRTRKNDAASTLRCTGIRAELVSRSGDAQSGFSNETPDTADGADDSAIIGSNCRQKGAQHVARKTDMRRFQWVTNDEGVANFLQRPPSRQKEAFPTHLADVVPYPAFQVEAPTTDERAKQLAEATRKNAVEQSRPPSRHKPPGQSLFLEVPEPRRQVQPAFAFPRGAPPTGAESCDGTAHSVDSADVEASSTTRDALEVIFALDRRHDNPDRDGKQIIRVQGPCPFRIEVTNSLMQPQPPTVAPNGREAVDEANPRKVAKHCTPDPSCGLFGSMSYDTCGRTGTEKQRAPINTTPTLAASAIGSSAPTRGDIVGESSYRLIGSRSTGGIALRGANIPGTCPVRSEDNGIGGGLSMPPPREGAENRELTAGGAVITEAEDRRQGERFAEDCVERGIKGTEGGNVLSIGRGNNSGLFVNTGAPGPHVSDWSLQSCDDVDDGAFFDGPALVLSESGGTKHSHLETTLGQDFLRLFAPSSGRENTSGTREVP